jgi:beta-glucosidase/6-phospho-beta-glucosidase/beta-galactosidase
MIDTMFKSFWMGGYECTDQLNHYGNRVDLLSLTGHIEHIVRDYKLLSEVNISTVREGIRWSIVEKRPYEYDFSTVAYMISVGKEQNIQQIWDICHFGYPDDLSPLHPHFERRFVALCEAFVKFYRAIIPDGPLLVTPINEVGFISWLGGDHASTTPYCRRMGWDVKYSLIRAYIHGIKSMKAIDSNLYILSTEPIVNIVPPLNASLLEIQIAHEQHEIQYQALDMLTGKICPELGGHPELIDYMGFNFYYNNQWISNLFDFLPWANLELDPRWRGLSSLLLEAYNRYGQPIVLAETSHSGEHRPNWLELITKECIKAIDLGVPLKGICLYPIIDRPDWDHLHVWHHSGLWDANETEPSARLVHQPYAEAILESQQLINLHLSQTTHQSESSLFSERNR